MRMRIKPGCSENCQKERDLSPYDDQPYLEAMAAKPLSIEESE